MEKIEVKLTMDRAVIVVLELYQMINIYIQEMDKGTSETETVILCRISMKKYKGEL